MTSNPPEVKYLKISNTVKIQVLQGFYRHKKKGNPTRAILNAVKNKKYLAKNIRCKPRGRLNHIISRWILARMKLK